MASVKRKSVKRKSLKRKSLKRKSVKSKKDHGFWDIFYSSENETEEFNEILKSKIVNYNEVLQALISDINYRPKFLIESALLNYISMNISRPRKIHIYEIESAIFPGKKKHKEYISLRKYISSKI